MDKPVTPVINCQDLLEHAELTLKFLTQVITRRRRGSLKDWENKLAISASLALKRPVPDWVPEYMYEDEE